MDISIVIPAYNEEDNVSILYDEITSVMKGLKKGRLLRNKYEIIFVDDGSSDNTFSRLKELNRKDRKVRVIRFRKNFGQTAALDAGFRKAQGKIIIAMDADLQNDPHDIPVLLKGIDKGYDCVSGWRKKRKDTLSKRLFSRLASLLRRQFTGETIHDSGCTLKAYRRECFKGLDLYGEMHRYIPALLTWRGFKVGEAEVSHRKRKYGKTKYKLKRVVKGGLDLLVVTFWQKYSARPIHLFGSLGLVCSLLGVLLGAYLIMLKYAFGQALSNRPLLLLALLLIILGVQFIILGVMADILIKIFYQRADSKPYSIKEEL